MDGKSILKLLTTDRPMNRKPPHKRADGKEMAQEENFLPKYQRVKDLCQKAEYQTSCQQPGQVPDLYEPGRGGYLIFKKKKLCVAIAG
ncbi:hypothetical protein XENOCAPTIV_027732 [Xenoophorus captivus]|uniref:Uncharacterized protein n=1 Tax=Xenoophorus captivus TaxID=1517983 RepID=A0ABV0RKH3_9TELE